MSSDPTAGGATRGRNPQQAGIFQGVQPNAASALTSQLQPANFPRGHTVFAPGDLLYIIISGKVKIGTRSPNGQETLLAILGPSDMFGRTVGLRPRPADLERHHHYRSPRCLDGPRRPPDMDR